MVGRILLLFMVVPLLELYLLLKFASWTSIPATFLLVLGTATCGSILATRQGMGAIAKFQSAVREGRMPGTEIVDGLLIVFAAAMLLAPGLITDTIGILLLLPWTRAIFRAWLVKRYANRFQVVSFGSAGFRSDEGDDTVDATFYRHSPKANREPTAGERIKRLGPQSFGG